MRITPSISLSWTIERQIESDECNEDENEENDDENNENNPGSGESSTTIEFIPVGAPPGVIIVDFSWIRTVTSSFKDFVWSSEKRTWIPLDPLSSDDSHNETRKLMIRDWLGFTRISVTSSGEYSENGRRYSYNRTHTTLAIATKITESIRVGDMPNYSDAAVDSYSEYKYGIPPWSLGSKDGSEAQWYWADGWGGGFDELISETEKSTSSPDESLFMSIINNFKWRINEADEENTLLEKPQSTDGTPISYPKMKKNCYSDPKLLKMVKEIHEVLDPEEIKKSQIPRRFLAIDGEGMEKMKSYNEIFQALFLMLDKQGYVPFSITKETADGDQVGIDFKHQSQALQAIIGHLVNQDDIQDDNEQIRELDRKYSEVTARLALAICQLISTSVHTNEMVYAILQFLGFKTQDIMGDVPIPLDPIGLKEFGAIDKNTEEDPDEFNKKVMAVLFSDSNLKVPEIKLSDNKTLQALFLELKTLTASKK
jgi:hypothetical protein